MAGLLNAFRQYARDAMPGGALNPEVTRQGLLDGAAIATMPVPVLGDAVGLLSDANRYATDPQSRTPLNFGLSALGLLPLVPSMTAARKITKVLPDYEMNQELVLKNGKTVWFRHKASDKSFAGVEVRDGKAIGNPRYYRWDDIKDLPSD